MCDGDASVVDHQAAEILAPGSNGQRRYYRFQARLDMGSDDMDDASSENIKKIKQLGEKMVRDNRETLETLARRLTA